MDSIFSLILVNPHGSMTDDYFLVSFLILSFKNYVVKLMTLFDSSNVIDGQLRQA